LFFSDTPAGFSIAVLLVSYARIIAEAIISEKEVYPKLAT